MGEKAVFAPMQHAGLRAASALALLAYRAQAGEAMEDGFSLLPLYLRAPQAERERAAREAASRG